jgi:hypothetical protein
MTSAQTGQIPPAAAAPVDGAATQLGGEIAIVQASSLPAGTKLSLTDKLSAADSALAAGDKNAAEHSLDAALNHIKAQSGKSIPMTMATELTGELTLIKAAIG